MTNIPSEELANIQNPSLLRFIEPTTSTVHAGEHAEGSPLIALADVGFILPNGERLFNGLQLNLQANRVGLVGANGVGKSILGQIIAGIIQPHQGLVKRHTPMAYIAQSTNVTAKTKVADMLGLGAFMQALNRIEAGDVAPQDFETLEGRWDLPARLEAIWTNHGLTDLSLDALAQELSPGQRMKAALSAALYIDKRFLLLDEPSNHLDGESRAWLYEELMQHTSGMLMISHDRELLEGVSQIVELSESSLTTYGGNYTFYKVQHAAMVEQAQTKLAQAKHERKQTARKQREQHDKQQQLSVRRKEGAKKANIDGLARGRQKDTADRTTGLQKQQTKVLKEHLDGNVKEAIGQLKEDASVLLTLPQSAVPNGKQVLTLTDVVLPYVKQTHPINLTLQGPVRVGVLGANGSGKTTLLKVMAGLLKPVSGQAELKVTAAWLDQSPKEVLPATKTVLEQLEINNSPLAYAQQRTQLAHLGLGAKQVDLQAQYLSGGQWFKAALACMLWSENPAQLLLMDEPTNHLDLWALESLEAALQQFTGAMVVVSHDSSFLNKIGMTHTLDVEAGQWQLKEV